MRAFYILKLNFIISLLIAFVPLTGTCQNTSLKKEEDSLRSVLRKTPAIDKLDILIQLISVTRDNELLVKKYIKDANSIAKEEEEDSLTIKALICEVIYDLEKEQFESARTKINNALNIATQLKNTNVWALTREQAGRLESGEGNLELAVEHYLIALRYFESQRNFKAEFRNLNYLGEAYTQIGQLDIAESYLTRALKVAKHINNIQFINQVQFNIGTIYYLKKDYARSISSYQIPLEFSQKNKDIDFEADIYFNLSIVYSLLKDYPKSLEYGQKCSLIREKQQDKRKIGQISLTLADLYLKTAKINDANQNALLALSIGQEFKSKIDILKAYLLLSKIAEQKNDIPLALSYYQRYFELKESTIDRKAIERINRLQQQYENDQTQRNLAIVETEKQFNQVRFREEAIIINSIVLSIACLAIAAIALYSRYRSKKKNNKLLLTQIQRINTQNEQIKVATLELNQALKQSIEQKEIIADKNHKIEDSLHYASLIQKALLPLPQDNDPFNKYRSIIYRTSDIISGDFYWMEQKNGVLYAAVVDCTGIGVSASFLCVMVFNVLNQIFQESLEENKELVPSQFLSECQERLTLTLKKNSHSTNINKTNNESNDSFEISIIAFHPQKGTLKFAGAGLPLLVLHKKHIQVFESCKHPIDMKASHKFQLIDIKLQPNDRFFIFTDGIKLILKNISPQSDSNSETGKHLGNYLLENANLTLAKLESKINSNILENSKLMNIDDDIVMLSYEYNPSIKVSSN